MKVYISIPFEEHSTEAQKNFREVATAIVKSTGHEVIDPLKDGIFDDRAQNLRKRLRLLLECDAILLWDGWEESDEGLMEREVARKCGITLVYSRPPLFEDLSKLGDADRAKLHEHLGLEPIEEEAEADKGNADTSTVGPTESIDIMGEFRRLLPEENQ